VTTSADAHRAGVVLAGGYSTRFGDRDKALVEVDGDPMLARVVGRLGDAVDRVVVSCRDAQCAPFERVLGSVDVPVDVVVDPVPDRGPLAGVARSFGELEAPYAAVVACDMPAVDPAFLASLFDRAAGRDGAVPELRNGRLQPAQAIYRVPAMRAAAERRLEADRRSLTGVVTDLDVAVVRAREVADLTTWRSLDDADTPDDLRTFE
jgi:molybdopterin-guanine dinucleotide biosynthesis protein A